MFRIATTLLLAALWSGCASTATDFVADHPAHSVTKGRVMRIDNLSTRNPTPLADGVAFPMADTGCVVRMTFDDGSEREFELRSSDILLCGSKTDFILEAPRDRIAR